MTPPADNLVWSNPKYGGSNVDLVIGDYTGKRIYFQEASESSGTVTFSYTYNGVTTSESLNYVITDDYDSNASGGPGEGGIFLK